MSAGPSHEDPVALIECLGIRADAPRAVVKAIVSAVEAMSTIDLKGVKLALAVFQLDALVEPGVSVDALAAGLVRVARSGAWPGLVAQCK